MSTRAIKYTTLYNTLKESIDFENSPSLPLKLDQDTRFNVGGLDVGMKVERYPQDGDVLFKYNSVLSNNFDPETYYNVGFDIEDNTIQTYKTDYKTLSKILGTVVKSTLTWIKQNKPEVLTIMPEGKDESEFSKKLNIYASILQGNESLLNSIGYYWDKTKIANKPGLYIAKK
jgi:hypothetical protein